jgi:apolipoprotein N-acyltransferase
VSQAWTRSLLGATLSAVLCVLAVWPFGLWFLAPVCLAPLVVCLHGAPTLRVVLVGQVHGTLVNAIGFHWIVPAMVQVAGLPLAASWLLFGVFCTLQGARTTVLVGLISIGERRGLFIPLAVTLAVVTAELFVPLLFPWYLGTLAASNVVWIQLAELGGPTAISCWLAATNGFGALAWLDRGRGPRVVLRHLLGGFTTVALATLVGLLLLTTAERTTATAPKSRIGVVQSNTGASEWAGRDPWAEQAASTLRLLARDPGVELIVWPETALPLPVVDSALSGLRRLPPTIPSSVPLLLGVPVLDSTARMFNSAVLLAGDGRVAGRYDKRVLVPLGEKPTLPFLEPAVRDFSPASGEQVPFILGARRLGLSICYEDLLPREFRSVVAPDTELLVNLSSDGWFAGSPGPRLHLALAAFRAVEHRRFMLRATTTGVSAVVAPTGRVVLALPEGKPAEEVVEVGWLQGRTLYARAGDAPWLVAPALLVILFFRGRRNRVRST